MDGDKPREGHRAVVRRALGAAAGTAVVAVFCYVTAGLFPVMRETYWAPIAAIVVMYPDNAATRQAGVQRLLGTVLGSLVGWGSATVWHHDPLVYGAAVLLAVGLCYVLRLEAAARLCAVAVTVITVIPHSESPSLAALFRCIEVSYGVACAVAYTALADRVLQRAQARSAP